ncbi:hypothetical protein PRZ48_009297 [Zasmidium cellare]|uniref:BTB domain-containing protein n=1 Tax=Zasmidium cellare TaxID=395010 RepID=A0ABR0EBB6_ZASCE|nr:hypothetical protein PRZ48_009297 [Zasmidium cellare]
MDEAMDVDMDAMLDGFQKLQPGGNDPDFTIASESGREWKVHKAVLLVHSNVLYEMSTSNDYAECRLGCTVIKIFEDRCIDALVNYLYNPLPCVSEYISAHNAAHLGSESSINEHRTFLIDTFNLGDMYNVAGLKQWALDRMKDWLHALPDISCVEKVVDMCFPIPNVPDEMWQAIFDVGQTLAMRDMGYGIEEDDRLYGKHPSLDVLLANRIAKDNPIIIDDDEDDVEILLERLHLRGQA